MSFSTVLSLAVSPTTPRVSRKDVNLRRQPPAAIQVKIQANHDSQVKLSRRDAVFFFTTPVVTSILPVAPANARIMNADIVQSFMEKLEKFGEMVGISKPKADSASEIEGKKMNDGPKDKNGKPIANPDNSKQESTERAEKPQVASQNPKPAAEEIPAESKRESAETAEKQVEDSKP